jgi:hypothetical protein
MTHVPAHDLAPGVPIARRSFRRSAMAASVPVLADGLSAPALATGGQAPANVRVSHDGEDEHLTVPGRQPTRFPAICSRYACSPWAMWPICD